MPRGDLERRLRVSKRSHGFRPQAEGRLGVASRDLAASRLPDVVLRQMAQQRQAQRPRLPGDCGAVHIGRRPVLETDDRLSRPSGHRIQRLDISDRRRQTAAGAGRGTDARYQPTHRRRGDCRHPAIPGRSVLSSRQLHGASRPAAVPPRPAPPLRSRPDPSARQLPAAASFRSRQPPRAGRAYHRSPVYHGRPQRPRKPALFAADPPARHLRHAVRDDGHSSAPSARRPEFRPGIRRPHSSDLRLHRGLLP